MVFIFRYIVLKNNDLQYNAYNKYVIETLIHNALI